MGYFDQLRNKRIQWNDWNGQQKGLNQRLILSALVISFTLILYVTSPFVSFKTSTVKTSYHCCGFYGDLDFRVINYQEMHLP